MLDRLQAIEPRSGALLRPPKGDMFSFVPATSDFNHAFVRPPIGHLFSRLVKDNDASEHAEPPFIDEM